MTGRPTIGLTLDSEAPGDHAKQPWYALRENYCASVVRAGGLLVLLPHEPDHAEAIFNAAIFEATIFEAAIFEAGVDACAGVRPGRLEARG